MTEYEMKLQLRLALSVLVAGVLAVIAISFIPETSRGNGVWAISAIGALIGMFFKKWRLDNIWAPVFAIFFGPVAFFTVWVTYPLFCKLWKIKRDKRTNNDSA